ncbi:hypothetical protein YC2023_072680 [Brassica napus]
MTGGRGIEVSLSVSQMLSFSEADLTELVLEILHEGAIRYEFPYCRVRAAMQIQVAWRYRKTRLGELTPFFFVCKLRENSLLKRNNTLIVLVIQKTLTKLYT